MKRKLFTLTLAVLTVGLLGSCSKLNERIDNLEKKVDGIENNQIATIGQQIAAINQSIANLETIRTNVQTLMDAKTAMGEDITKLKAADQTLEGKINDLKTYVDKELAKYATKDWANATFASLAKQEEIITDVEKLKTDIAGFDDKLDQAIANLDSSLKSWVNKQLSGYYTAAEINVKIDNLKSDIEALEGDNETNKTKIEELETSLAQLTQDLATAKSEIKAAYEKAINDAISGNSGYINSTIKNAIDAANANITALTGRVTALESDVATLKNDVAALKAMIQTVSIIPAYSNGSLKAVDGILTINCVITPKKAVESLTKDSFTIFTSESEVLTKSALYGTITIASDEDLVLDKENGTATIKVDVSDVLPAEEDKALTVAVNVKNGISDFTTEFVPVTVAGPDIPEGALPGKFTVNAEGKQVHFSKGNLWADGSNVLHFEDAQWKTTPASDGSKDASHVSHFTWSDNVASAVGGSNSGSNLFCDESHKQSVDGSAAIYYALSTAEWQYLFNYGDYTNNIRKDRFKWATVNGVGGYVIAPDDFAGTFKDTYTDDADLANAGNLVFLPAAGFRYGSNVFTVGGYGRYWSSSAFGSDYAYRVNFSSSDVYPDVSVSRDGGYSVRLITESK